MTEWILLVVRVPTEPARHRIAVWRELRKAGAVPLAGATWALPDVQAAGPVVARVSELVERGSGEVLRLRGRGVNGSDDERLLALHATARAEEWREFLDDCDKFLAELHKEHDRQKYTLAELEEEEQSLERLRRWFREIRGRDLLGTAQAADADQRLKTCSAGFDEYADAVYRRLSDPAG